MRIEELVWVCQEAARDLVGREARPLPATVVIPDAHATRVVHLRGFPDDDDERAHAVERVANDELLDRNAPAYGFLAEAEVEGHDVLVLVYGTKSHAPSITAAPLLDDGTLGEFSEAEPLDPAALRFLHPLQHAVAHAAPPEGPLTDLLPLAPA